ncbi:MAG: hypothetical protein ABIL68_11925 [bacterium]
MKSIQQSIRVILIFMSILFMRGTEASSQQDDLKIWKEFVKTLTNGEMTLERIRPFGSVPKETLMGWLNIIKEKASLKELQIEPECHRVENKVHFIVPLTFEASGVDYCFTFITEGDDWYFHILEAIFIRLDKIDSLPTTTFPDISEDQKAWDREEWRVTKDVRLFNFLAQEKEKDFAFRWFKDGYGFFSAAQVRVPFVPPSKAFILYLCWYQANLTGNSVELVKLEEDEAVVEMQLMVFQLYKNTSHLKQQIAFDDYQKIFESIWMDRAEKAGWNLKIEYHLDAASGRFVFTK